MSTPGISAEKKLFERTISVFFHLFCPHRVYLLFFAVWSAISELFSKILYVSQQPHLLSVLSLCRKSENPSRKTKKTAIILSVELLPLPYSPKWLGGGTRKRHFSQKIHFFTIIRYISTDDRFCPVGFEKNPFFSMMNQPRDSFIAYYSIYL